MVKKTKEVAEVIPVSREMTEDEIEKLKKLAAQLEGSRGGLDDLYKRYHEMYFMTDDSKPKWSDVDENDIAVTISPSARNEVVGMVRLLETSEINVTVNSDGKKYSNSDKIEEALKTMLRVSGEYRRARVESDAALSAVLDGPVTLYAESLDDVIEVNKEPYRLAQLDEIKGRTPFIIRTINAEQSYPLWGEFGLMAHLWKYDLQGSALKERWGVECDADKSYTVRDIYDNQFRLVYAEGISEKLLAVTHGMKRIPIVQRYAGGTSLFHKPEEQMQAFLYAKAKSRLDKRENALLTAISTAVNTRGLMGPLLAIESENAPETIEIKYHGSVRTIVGKATQVDDKVIDPVVFKWKEMLDNLSGESTIYGQTLGENIAGAGSTFSGLAMLSSAGKLPLIDQQRALEMAFRDIFLHILQRIKSETIPNDLIEASEIPDDVDLEVSMEAKLPQDQLRNATVASNLGPLVSKEWKRTELLQITDSNAMTKQVEKESIREAMLGIILQDAELMRPFIQAVLGMTPTGDGGQGMGRPMTGDGGLMTGDERPRTGDGGVDQVPPNAQMGEQLPKTDAMIPPKERQ